MSYAVLAAVVTLAGVAVIACVAKFALRPFGSFAAGAGPMIAAVGGAFGLVLPAFLIFEPRHDGEPHGVIVLLLAAVGTLLLSTWIWRIGRIMLCSYRLVDSWTRRGTPIHDARWGVEALAIDSGSPIVAIAGIVRPRVFIDRRILESCSSAELDGIAAHEIAHLRRRDNLRRLLVGACSGMSSARAAAWRESAEFAADLQAAATPHAATNLAAALLKISRMRRAQSFDGLLVSTIHDAAPLEARILRLLDVSRPQKARRSRALPWSAALISAPFMPAILEHIHHGIELAVRHLP